MSYPNAGPRKGIVIYNPLGVALFSGRWVSAIVPAPIARAGENVIPAKKRRMHRVQMFCEKPAPTVKIAPRGADTRYTTRRPYVSDIGAARSGPNPRAKTYSVRGSRATVEETPNCAIIAGTAGE